MMHNKVLRGPGTELFQTPIPLLDIAQPTIPFMRMPLPERSLIFLPRPPMLPSRKRGRAAADVDGEHSCLQKKKRRLRLFLITSRLSPQFSHPATNIVDRGTSRIAHWAKQKAAGRNLLPKAAVLNCIRRGAVAARDAVSRRRLLVEQEKEQQQLELARLTFNYGAIHTYTRPVQSPSEPMPLGAAVREANHHLVPGSQGDSSVDSPNTSRSPSPTSISPPFTGLSHDMPSNNKSPNAAYALSPPRIPSSTRTYEPHLPSPLGLSNYDAFDDVPGSKPSSQDMYSRFDNDGDDDINDGDEDCFSYFWAADDDDDNDNGGIDVTIDDRHDTPFSPTPRTMDSRPSAHTERPPHSASPQQQRSDTTPPLQDPRTPPSDAGTASRPAKAQRDLGYAFAGFEAGHLAVQYPGAPVACEFEGESVVKPVARAEMAPACMSPNFMAADVEWGAG